MANPAPTINQINAFNATQGTIIDFNIIGGTELVRSNRIYIYDLSDNSLICTHLYASTESIHELPPNTDGSIVYESGKSSTDFVNGAQYYAQIQTYTDTAGTEGGSGLSVAKMFWCLVDPTLTITTIPSTISTTSYNVSATYNANTSVVSNIIQQYQFSLYSATGSLLQSSGVIVGSGAQQGTSTTYDISYNFTGLSVGSSYYVVVDVTTTQGMSISAQSGTFAVSIDTPTLGEATVVNNACDGYISVISNLSGEYGGSASGEIASFVTNSVNDVSSLKVNIKPKQDGTPWNATTADVTPYNFRKVPSVGHSINSEYDKIVGGTVAWNQLVNPERAKTVTTNGITFTSDGNGKWTVSGTSTGRANAWVNRDYYKIHVVKSHKYAVVGAPANATSAKNHFAVVLYEGDTYRAAKITAGNGVVTLTDISYDVDYAVVEIVAAKSAGITVDDIFYPQLIDLTQMFGSTIADYIYSLEQATAGAGVAWLKEHFPKMFNSGYMAYDSGTLKSVEGLQSHDTVGFNQLNKSTFAKGRVDNGVIGYQDGTTSFNLTDTGVTFTTNIAYRGVVSEMFNVVPLSTYYVKFTSTSSLGCFIDGYDANGNFVKRVSNTMPVSGSVTVPQNVYKVRFSIQATNAGTHTVSDICINIDKPTGTPKNGDYVPYEKHSYALDSDLVLRGIPKLDSSNKLYYDGDTYASDGSVTRKYGIVDLGTLNWVAETGRFRLYSDIGARIFTDINSFANIICTKYETGKQAWISDGIHDKYILGLNWGYGITIVDSSYTDAATFKSAMSGIYLVYELATTTTETADSYTNPQIVDADGTEEYVTTSIVPVGHETYYADIYPISGYDGVNVNIHGKNLLKTTLTSQTSFGLSFNGNADGSISIQGTSTGTYPQVVVWNKYKDSYPKNTDVTLSVTTTGGTPAGAKVYVIAYERDTPNGANVVSHSTKNSGLSTFQITHDYVVVILVAEGNGLTYTDTTVYCQIELGSSATDYEPYSNETYTAEFDNTVYGGEVDLVSGVLTVDRAMVDLGTLTWSYPSGMFVAYLDGFKDNARGSTGVIPNAICSAYEASTLANVYGSGDGIFSLGTSNNYAGRILFKDSHFTSASDFKTAVNGVMLCYELATPQEIQLTPQQIQTLVGENYVSADAGDVEVTYNIPITNLLVKRQDIADVSGAWLTLYSQPITQASDMDFTFIDFLNQYGKTYKYALVPLLTQTQSGVEVEVEGGYTVSDEVQSIFDGVFIADQTGLQKCKANVGYGDVDMNQAVGTITPIGAKYPVVITNSKNQYHNGSITGTIVPDDYYFNGNLSRIDMVNKRNELEQFLTNKRAKIIKDWNSNIWLVMIMDNINCTFNNEYGMGIVNFNANWIEVGDPTNQQDLQATGLIDVGGV